LRELEDEIEKNYKGKGQRKRIPASSCLYLPTTESNLLLPSQIEEDVAPGTKMKLLPE